jgi:hypothetical protein
MSAGGTVAGSIGGSGGGIALPDPPVSLGVSLPAVADPAPEPDPVFEAVPGFALVAGAADAAAAATTASAVATHSATPRPFERAVEVARMPISSPKVRAHICANSFGLERL